MVLASVKCNSQYVVIPRIGLFRMI